MGIYVNPGDVSFRRALNSEIYIDKTELICAVNKRIDTANCFMCVSRPRRFGKSMAADMLVAYYSKGCESEELFAGKKVNADRTFKEHLNRHNVIHLDVQQFLFHESHLNIFIEKMQRVVITELRQEFGDCFEDDAYGLPDVLRQIYACTGKGFIFVIDEWDCVFRTAKEKKEIQKEYLDFLRGLFKGAEYVELAYMTGILPIKKYGEQSAINIFDEYSVTDSKNLGEYFGFTEEEVREQCAKYGVDFSEMEQWYDGYRLGTSHIYNPKSVVDALTWKKMKSYWTGTETYEALKVYIERNFDGLKEAVVEMLGGGQCKIDPVTFQNDMTTFHSKDDVLTLLVHLGYLTYDEQAESVLIPNKEVEQEFVRAMKVGGWGNIMELMNV